MRTFVGVTIMLAMFASPLSAGDESGQGAKGPKDDWPQTDLMKQCPRAVLAHVMVSFRSKAHSGKWRMWNYRNKFVNHAPEQRLPDGRPDVASVYYPAIGPYDMTDPATAECHCQLAKMSGIDGFVFDLGSYYEYGSQTPDWHIVAMKLYADTMADYGLKAAAVYEDKVHWIWDRSVTTRRQAVDLAHRDMTLWMKLLEKVQFKIGERPVLMFFSYQHDVEGKGVSRLSPDELGEWLNAIPAERRPVVATQWFQAPYKGLIQCWYDWTLSKKAPPEMPELRHYASFEDVKGLYGERRKRILRMLDQGFTNLHMTCVFPGFDDHGCWGWGDGPRLVPREDGKLYRWLWERVVEEEVPVVQIATWNDWFEGTIIEPGAEFGTQYLEITREFAAQHKKLPPITGDLNLPIRIYRIRKSTDDPKALDAMNRASRQIRAGKYDQAGRIVQPWAARLKVDEGKFWIPPGTDVGSRPAPKAK